MIENDNGTIRAVAWREIFPWLCIARVFRIAIAARCLFFGAAGVLLTGLGWFGIESCFSNAQDEQTQTAAFCQHNAWARLDEAVPDRIDLSSLSSTSSAVEDFEKTNPVTTSWALLNSPTKEGLTKAAVSVGDIARLILCGLWGTFVWGFFGTAICRIAAVRLAADETVGAGAALRYAWQKWSACLAAPLLPLGGVFLVALPVVVLGWILRWNVGMLLGGLVWPLALVAGFIMTVLLAGVFFGWPLMWAAISTEGSDSFDALSRSYAYLFQRPLHYLFYSAVAAFCGWLGWIVVRNFASGIVWFSYWAASWGCDGTRLFNATNVSNALRSSETLQSDVAPIGGSIIRFWITGVQLLAVGYVFSYFWSASAAIYLLLRRDVDAAEMDEVFLDANEPTPGASSSIAAHAAAVEKPADAESTEEITGEHE
jgi:hypothetical protein